MSQYRSAKRNGKVLPGVYVRHTKHCPNAIADDSRCRCSPSYRAKTRDHGWSPTYKAPADAIGWKADADRGRVPTREERSADRIEAQRLSELTLRSIVEQWWQAASNADIGTRRKRTTYRPNTLRQYRTAIDEHILPLYGNRPAHELTLRDWQAYADGLRKQGLKTNSINCYLNPMRAVYAWACHPARALLPTNAVVGVELPPRDETPRDRVVPARQAAALIAALDPALEVRNPKVIHPKHKACATTPDDAIVFGLCFYAGTRRSEAGAVDWRNVDLNRGGVFVPDSKSEAGVRWVPLVKPLQRLLTEAHLRAGKPSEGRILQSVVDSCVERAYARWAALGMERMSPHECRHTFVSYMADAGIALKVQAAVAGHEDETMTLKRYTHMMPEAVTRAGEALDAYLEAVG